MIKSAAPEPRFSIGQLVLHSRYAYRGVVVALDRICQAPDWWYERNQTRPERNQAWYHVLVDQTSHSGQAGPTATYAAESSLLPAETSQPIDHPLVDQFFTAFDGRRYRRNDRTWPGTW